MKQKHQFDCQLIVEEGQLQVNQIKIELWAISNGQPLSHTGHSKSNQMNFC